ncbi:MAG: FHA domain-containing protein [Thermodesulfobacteriota bacterium]
MPTFTLKFKENVISEYRLEKGQSMTIGRREDNTVCIENLAVSGHHAKIDSVGDNFLLTDLQSKNGSFVNEQKVTSHWLKNGDLITIGKHTLAVAFSEGETQPESADGMDQTMVMDTEKYRSLLAKSALKDETKVLDKDQPAVLSYLAGGEGEIELSKKLIKIGKDSSCDIVVGGLMMGHTAATISRRPNGYFLSFVSGMTKPKVNGETVKESVKLNEFDTIEIASVKLQFVFQK